MNNTLNSAKVPVPPAFMATTRQKIMLKNQGITDTAFLTDVSPFMQVVSTIGNLTKNIVAFAKRI